MHCCVVCDPPAADIAGRMPPAPPRGRISTTRPPKPNATSAHAGRPAGVASAWRTVRGASPSSACRRSCRLVRRSDARRQKEVGRAQMQMLWSHSSQHLDWALAQEKSTDTGNLIWGLCFVCETCSGLPPVAAAEQRRCRLRMALMPVAMQRPSRQAQRSHPAHGQCSMHVKGWHRRAGARAACLFLRMD